MEGPWLPSLQDAATQPSVSIPLAITQSYDPTEWQERWKNIVCLGQPCAQQKVGVPSLDGRMDIIIVFVIILTVYVGHLLCIGIQLHNHTIWLFPSYR